MSTLVLHAPTALVTFAHKLGETVKLVFEGIADARVMAERYDALSRLSDAQLARRGLTRADIPQVALTGRKPR
jgi:hypothetical protein